MSPENLLKIEVPIRGLMGWFIQFIHPCDFLPLRDTGIHALTALATIQGKVRRSLRGKKSQGWKK
jgi:hypothetical protein